MHIFLLYSIRGKGRGLTLAPQYAQHLLVQIIHHQHPLPTYHTRLDLRSWNFSPPHSSTLSLIDASPTLHPSALHPSSLPSPPPRSPSSPSSSYSSPPHSSPAPRLFHPLTSPLPIFRLH